MTTFLFVLKTALPVFIALALGAMCRRTGFLSREGVDSLKKVVVNITLPAVLLNAFATADYSGTTVAIAVSIFLMCCLALLLGFLVIRLTRTQSKLAPFLASGFEVGMIGYALFVLLFPDRSISELAIVDIGHTLFVFTIYKILLTGKTDWKAIGKDMVSSPILWSVAIGALIGATGLYNVLIPSGVSGVLDGITDFVGAPTGMVILLTIGYDLVLKEIPWKKTVGFIAMRLGILAICYGLLVLVNRTLLNSAIFEGAALLMMILPPPYVIPVFTDEPSERVQISSSLSAMTLVTILLFAILSVFVQM